MDEIKEYLLQLLEEDQSITEQEMERIISRFDLSDSQTAEILDFAAENGLISYENSELDYFDTPLVALSLYQKELGEFDTISFEKETELAKAIKRGDEEAKTKLVEANLRLVYQLAQKLSHNDKQLLEDLIQEGNIGLTMAAERYDVDKGNRFSTYAIWWIQKYMYAFLNSNHTIIIPEKTYLSIKNVKETKEKLAQELLREPTEKEIAQALDIDLKQLRKTMSYDFNISSIDNTKGEVALKEDDYLEKEIISDLLDCLDDEKDKQIIRLYLGLDCPKPMNYSQIGQVLKISKQAVGQRYNKAIRKMKESYDK